MAFKLASDAAAYVVVNTKPDVLEKSSSGGAFSLLAELNIRLHVIFALTLEKDWPRSVVPNMSKATWATTLVW